MPVATPSCANGSEMTGWPGCRLPAAGSSPDGGWAEESVAVVGIDRAAARALGREFGQHAVFEVADGLLRVHACFDGWIDERPL